MAKAKPKFYAPSVEETEKESRGNRTPGYCYYEVWVPKDGTNTIRILPSWRENGPLFKYLYIHWFGDRDNVQSALCLKKFGKRCFICEEIARLLAQGVIDKEQAYRYGPNRRAFCNGIDMDAPEEGVKIMALPASKVADEIKKWLKKDGYSDFWHPETGRNAIIERESSGQYPTYSVLPAANPTPIPDFSVLDDIKNLDDFKNVWKVYTYDEMKDLWLVYSDIVKPVEDIEPEIDVDSTEVVELVTNDEDEDSLDVEKLLE